MIGTVLGAPIGPVGILFIRKIFELDFRGTILIGLGVALADSMYGAIAALGLSVIAQFLLGKVTLIKIIGGMLLLYLAYKELNSTTLPNNPPVKDKANFRLAIEVFLLTLANPLTILSFISVFAFINEGPTTYMQPLMMVLGIFLGSMTWWLALGAILPKAKNKLSQTWLQRIRYVSALVLGGFGVVAIISGLRSGIKLLA